MGVCYQNRHPIFMVGREGVFLSSIQLSHREKKINQEKNHAVNIKINSLYPG